MKGLNWNGGAIGNAVWSGAPLIDVLKFCGLTDLSKIRHIQVIFKFFQSLLVKIEFLINAIV